MKAENIQDVYELSPAQQGILFHSLYSPDSGVYITQQCFLLHGNLHISAFECAWQQVVDRHAILRTGFYWKNLDKPLQVVRQEVKFALKQYDWQELTSAEQQKRLETFLEKDLHKDFELAQPPLIRLSLIQLAGDVYQIVLSQHHLILDGWSCALVIKEVVELYEAFSHNQDKFLEPSRTYGEYVGWLQQQDLSKAEKFWRQLLSGIKSPTPLIKLNIEKSSGREERYDNQILKLSTETTAALQNLAQQHHLTLNALIQGAWAVLLSRYSGEDEVVYGNTVSGRPVDLVGVDSMVGMFINTLPVRISVDAEQTLIPWLKQIQAQLVEMRQYEYSSLVKIQEWSEIPRGIPLFESIVVFENYPMNQVLQEQKANLTIQNFRSIDDRTNYPLTIMVIPALELELKLSYKCSRFDISTISRMMEHFQTLLQGMVSAPEMPLKDLPLLTEVEKYQLLTEWNNTQAPYPQDICIHQLFEARVEKTPNAVAVVFEGQQLTYRELNQRANQLAHYLKKLEVKSEILVGICVERSLEMVIGLLGILKAGGAYVPLDPAYPQDRLAWILSDSQASILLTQQHLAEKLPQHQAHVFCLDTDWETTKLNSENLLNRVTPENLAYVIYTSGSTGQPKGVQITHSSVINFLTSMATKPGLTAQDTLLAVTSISFDIAALELYLPLITGARLELTGREAATDPKQLAENLNASSATVMQATPATWRMLLSANWQGNPQLKILCGGEALPRSLAEKLLNKGTALWNLYGPTETTIWSTAYRVEATQFSGAIVPIGGPIANSKIYLLDPYGQSVPVGIPGELHIGGAGLARGYLNRPELTAERFITNAAGERLYKSGDLARYLPDGNIEYIERLDHQVKVRGFRIELGEIEAALSQHPAVIQAIVITREDESENRQLVAYVVVKDESFTINEQLEFLKQKLPEYMVPSAFITLDTLPLTPNGKINRKALPAPDENLLGEHEYVKPRTPDEEIIANIFENALNVKNVGIYDNFFKLGGHSLLATQVISRIEKTFKVELPLRFLFESPKVIELAEAIQVAKELGPRQQVPPIERISRNEKLPLSFAQARLWFLDQLSSDTITYNHPAAVSLVGALNIAALGQTFNEIVRRHEVLRTTFPVFEGQPIQRIAPFLDICLPVVNLCQLSEAEQKLEVQRLVKEWNQGLFDLAQGPLLKVTLLKLDEQEHLLLFNQHHIVSDGWSVGVLIRELVTLYEAFSKGQSSPLPELPIQYVDFAVWQKQWLQGAVLETQLAYWKQQLDDNPPVLELPTDQWDASTITSCGSRQFFALSSTLTESIKTLSYQEGVTLFMILLSAFNTLIHSYKGQEDILVGSPIANRNRSETEELIGFFVNTLVLRTNLSGNPSFRECLGRVREITLGAYAHQDLPFEKLVSELELERNLKGNPLFRVWFVLQNAPMPTLELSGLNLNVLEVEAEVARHDLKLDLIETPKGLEGFFEYKTDLFKASTIARMIEFFKLLLSTVVQQPDIQLNELRAVLAEAQRQQQLSQEKEFQESRRQKLSKLGRRTISGIRS